LPSPRTGMGTRAPTSDYGVTSVSGPIQPDHDVPFRVDHCMQTRFQADGSFNLESSVRPALNRPFLSVRAEMSVPGYCIASAALQHSKYGPSASQFVRLATYPLQQ